MHGVRGPDPMDMSFAEIWTHWRALRGVQAQQVVVDAGTARMAQADAKHFKQFLKERGHG
jgi:hypothetical protein